MFAQPFDHSFNDLFNQYVNMESSTADGNKDPSLSGDLEQLFPLDLLSSDCGDLSPSASISKRHHQSPHPWSKEWSLQDESADQGFAFHETVQPAAISDLSLNNFDASQPTGAHRVSPSTPPATPRRQATKSALVTPKSIRHRDPNDRRALLRKQSFSPSMMMRSANLQKGRMAYPEAWAQRLQNFSLHNSDERLPLSPPPSDVLVQHETMSARRDSAEMPPQFDARLFHQSPAISMPSPSTGALARHQQQYMNHASSSALTNSSPPPADDIFSSSHSSDPQSISSWHSDALGTPSLSFTPDLQGHDAQAWWSPMTSRVAQQQVAAPATHQRSMQSVGNQSDMMQGGLMIQFDPSFDMSSTADSTFTSSVPTGQESHYQSVSSNPPKFVAPFTTPQMHSSRSPSLSPKAVSSSRNGATTKITHRRNHSRKLSAPGSSGPKPAKSSGSSPRGSNKLSVSFVNFTANDSKKILTGVAPSGSSKTKARREQEARERRRKLSEAALIAVRNAGGDVEALEAVFC